MKKWIFLITYLFSLSFGARALMAQKQINIGEDVPDIAFRNVMNAQSKILHLSDFKGKLVILDFYGTWCGSCQPGIPKLDSIQKVLGDKLQVIVVCHDTNNQTVEKAIASRWKGKKLALPFVLTDSLLNGMFPHKIVPHEVWISPEGKLLSITDADALTYMNIAKAIEGQKQQMVQKVDQMDFDRNKPLFENGNGGSIRPMLFRSVFSNHIDGIISGAGNNVDTANNLKRVYFLNAPIIELYQYGADLHFMNRILLDLQDSGKLIPDIDDKVNWYKKNTYCYEITHPLSLPEDRMRGKWLSDLNFNLNLNGRIEKRPTQCWVLIRKKQDDTSLYSKGLAPVFTEKTAGPGMYKGQKVFSFINKPVQFFNYILNGDTRPIIVDETGIKGNIDIEFPVAHLHDMPALKKDLNAYGLDLEPAVREVELLVISDR